MIIAIILNRLNITEVSSVLEKTNLLLFIIACIFYFGLNIVLASRLGYLLTRIGYRTEFRAVFFSHMGGMIAGDLTPGRGGYFLTPPLLKKNIGIRITDGMACIFAPQGIEFVLKVGGAAAAILYISRLSGISNDLLISAGIGTVLLLVVGVLMLIISWHNENITLKFIRKLPFFRKFTENISFFKERSIQLKSSINVILILYIIGWVFAALQWFYLGKALGIQLSFFVFFLLHPLITILMFIPVSIAGLGLMEGGVVLVLSLFGVLPTVALAFSFLIRVSIILVDLMGLKTVMSSFQEL